MTTETHGAQTIDPLDLRNLIETMPTPAVCALPDGSIEFANRAWLEYTGCLLQQFSGWVWQSTIHPDDVAKFIDEWTAALAGGKPFQTEARIRRADGQCLWFLIRKALAVTPTRGRESALRTLIACEDIHERKQAEAKLEQGEELLQAFFENGPNPVTRTEREDDRARLTVQDVGVGIEPSGVDKVFEPFYTTKSGGMGIGLSVSRSIIERHHGRLWATLNDGPGAAFSFSIPRSPEGFAHSDGLRNT